jgi:hypothetical protein
MSTRKRPRVQQWDAASTGGTAGQLRDIATIVSGRDIFITSIPTTVIKFVTIELPGRECPITGDGRMSQIAIVLTMVIAALALVIWNSGGDRRIAGAAVHRDLPLIWWLVVALFVVPLYWRF